MGQHSISVLGIKTFAYHGCLDQEAIIGQEFEVNVHFQLDFEEAAEADDYSTSSRVTRAGRGKPRDYSPNEMVGGWFVDQGITLATALMFQ